MGLRLNTNSFIYLASLQACSSTNNQEANNESESPEVIYHVFQRSFYDSNGDENGDLNGLREKLDYLQDLGVTSSLNSGFL